MNKHMLEEAAPAMLRLSTTFLKFMLLLNCLGKVDMCYEIAAIPGSSESVSISSLPLVSKRAPRFAFPSFIKIFHLLHPSLSHSTVCVKDAVFQHEWERWTP